MIPKTVYGFAKLTVDPFELKQVPVEQRKSVDRIALAVEENGGQRAIITRTLILRKIGDALRATYTDARNVPRWLAILDRRLAVWAACVCAREALRFVPEGEHRPRVAIETTERWLAGAATTEEVEEARQQAWRASATAATAARAAAYAAYAAYAAASATDASAAYAVRAADAADAAADAAYAANARAPAWDAARIAELARLVGVVADALPGLPPEVIA